jgi:hypothetical protein
VEPAPKPELATVMRCKIPAARITTTKSPAAAAVVDNGISLKFKYAKPRPSCPITISSRVIRYPPKSFVPRRFAVFKTPVGDVKKVPIRKARLADPLFASSSVKFPVLSADAR